MVLNSWIELQEKCPIDISRMRRYANDYYSLVNVRISLNNLNKAKKNLLEARSNLDAMISSFIQLLYDKEILKEPNDRLLFSLLVDNFGRFLRKIDEQEEELIVKQDEPSGGLIGISRLSAYAKLLKNVSDSLIYESLLKASKEYEGFKETEKIRKEPRTFLYILFQVLQITLSVMGGITREKTTMKRGVVSSIPTNWQLLMGEKGQDLIKKSYKEEKGDNLIGLEDLEDLEESDEVEDEDT